MDIIITKYGDLASQEEGGRPQKMLASQDPSPSPIAKLDTRHINRGPRKDACEAGDFTHFATKVPLSIFHAASS